MEKKNRPNRPVRASQDGRAASLARASLSRTALPQSSPARLHLAGAADVRVPGRGGRLARAGHGRQRQERRRRFTFTRGRAVAVAACPLSAEGRGRHSWAALYTRGPALAGSVGFAGGGMCVGGERWVEGVCAREGGRRRGSLRYLRVFGSGQTPASFLHFLKTAGGLRGPSLSLSPSTHNGHPHPRSLPPSGPDPGLPRRRGGRRKRGGRAAGMEKEKNEVHWSTLTRSFAPLLRASTPSSDPLACPSWRQVCILLSGK